MKLREMGNTLLRLATFIYSCGYLELGEKGELVESEFSKERKERKRGRGHRKAIIEMLTTSGEWEKVGDYLVLKPEYNNGSGRLAYNINDIEGVYPQVMSVWRSGVSNTVDRPYKTLNPPNISINNTLQNTLMQSSEMINALELGNSNVENAIDIKGDTAVTNVVVANNSEVTNSVKVQNGRGLDFMNRDKYPWLKKLISYCTVLIFGAPGSGKTTMALHIVSERVKKGHDVVVLDSHDQKGKWGKLKAIGGGKDFQAIDDFLLSLREEVDRRYQEYYEGKHEAEFDKLTIVVEEFTNWSDKVANSKEIAALIPDARKVGVYLLMIAHSDTLSSLGGATGAKAKIEKATMSLELFAKESEDEVEPAVPTMTGSYKPPGKKNIKAEVTPVYIPELDRDEISRTLGLDSEEDIVNEGHGHELGPCDDE